MLAVCPSRVHAVSLFRECCERLTGRDGDEVLSTLGLLTLVLAVLLTIESTALLVTPKRVRGWLQRFPRDIWSGRLLAGFAILWAAWVVYNMPLGRFETWKPLVWPIAILLAGFVWYYMDELLGPRALGALLLLYPAPVLASARLHPSPWSVVMSVLAYVCVVKGMALLLGPYWFRLAVERFLSSDRNCRLWGSAGLTVAVLLYALILFAY